MLQHIINRDMIDRRSRCPWRPWDSQGRHAGFSFPHSSNR
jgi:hypothetical protein